MTELLIATTLEKSFKASAGFKNRSRVDVLGGVSLSVNTGETVGLVGESGSGKTTLARCLMGMLKPDQGCVMFDGMNMHDLNKRQRQQTRRLVSMVYQNPFLSLNPHFTLHQLIAEPLRAEGNLTHNQQLERVAMLMQQVGLSDIASARKVASLSGGQAQRVAIARALALRPKLIVLDEPTSALDVSVQAQILNLLVSLQKRWGYSYFLITHDLDVVRYLCDRVLVMLDGKIVEEGGIDAVMENPQHDYTKSLIASTPDLRDFL